MSSLRNCGRGWYIPSALRAVCALQHIWTYRVIEERSSQMKKIHLHEDNDGLGVKTLKTLWGCKHCLWVKRMHKRQVNSSKSLFQQRWTSTPLGWDDDALNEKFSECKNYVCRQFGPLLIYTSCWCSVVQACSRKTLLDKGKEIKTDSINGLTLEALPSVPEVSLDKQAQASYLLTINRQISVSQSCLHVVPLSETSLLRGPPARSREMNQVPATNNVIGIYLSHLFRTNSNLSQLAWSISRSLQGSKCFRQKSTIAPQVGGRNEDGKFATDRCSFPFWTHVKH